MFIIRMMDVPKMRKPRKRSLKTSERKTEARVRVEPSRLRKTKNGGEKKEDKAELNMVGLCNMVPVGNVVREKPHSYP